MEMAEEICRYMFIASIIAMIAYSIFAFIEHEKAVKKYRESTQRYKEAVEEYGQAAEEYKEWVKNLEEIIKTEANQ